MTQKRKDRDIEFEPGDLAFSPDIAEHKQKFLIFVCSIHEKGVKYYYTNKETNSSNYVSAKNMNTVYWYFDRGYKVIK